MHSSRAALLAEARVTSRCPALRLSWHGAAARIHSALFSAVVCSC